MKTIWFPKLATVVLFSAGLVSKCLAADGPQSGGNEAPGPAAKGGADAGGKTPALEKLPELLAENCKDVRQKIEAARKLVDAEAAAGRLPAG